MDLICSTMQMALDMSPASNIVCGRSEGDQASAQTFIKRAPARIQPASWAWRPQMGNSGRCKTSKITRLPGREFPSPGACPVACWMLVLLDRRLCASHHVRSR